MFSHFKQFLTRKDVEKSDVHFSEGERCEILCVWSGKKILRIFHEETYLLLSIFLQFLPHFLFDESRPASIVSRAHLFGSISHTQPLVCEETSAFFLIHKTRRERSPMSEDCSLKLNNVDS